MSTPRRRGLALAPRFLLGLMANLAGVAAVLAVVLGIQLRWKPEWLFAGRAGERLQAIAEILATELARSPATDWNDIVSRHAEIYRLELLLVDPAGNRIAGPPTELPRDVQRRLLAGPRPGPGRGARRPDGQPPAQELFTAPPQPVGRRQAFQRAVVRGGEPPAYWIIVRLPGGRPRSEPVLLVVRVPSLWTGGVFFDLWPWALAGAAALGVSALLWTPFIRRLTRDLGRITRQTEIIASGNWDTRLHLARTDELGRLGEAIDRMAACLADRVEGQRRFLRDAAHELCSPLARMQAALALLEDGAPTPAAPRLQDLREEVDEMASLVNQLLAFSRATHGPAPALQAVPLADIITRAWKREGEGRALLQTSIPADCRVRADASLLQRAMGNLLRNAVRYAASAGPIGVDARRLGEAWEIRVADVGPGVPEDSLPRLFEPFYRPEASRSRDLGGTGLGLAIAKTCAETCGGTLRAANRQPRGFEVTLTLPAA